jgi:multiple sugar transport system substrate-binding protein
MTRVHTRFSTPRRRLFLTAAIGTVGALALAACGASSGGSAATSSGGPGSFKGQMLTVQFNPVTTNAAGYDKYYAALASAFNKATGATVKYESTSMSFQEQLPQIAASQSGPDIIAASTSASAYQSNSFVRLSAAEWQTIGGESQFNPGQLNDSGPAGGPYDEVPLYNVPYVMVYNTTLFKAAGITKPPTTWTEYVADAQKVNDPSKGVYGTSMDPSDSANQDAWKTPFYFLQSYGGTFDTASGQPTLTTSAAAQAYEFWFDWYTKFHIVNPDGLTWQNPQMAAAFAAGDVGELPAVTSADIPLFESGKVGKDFAFATVPGLPYGESAYPSGGHQPSRLAQAGLYITSFAPTQLALQFVKVVLSTKMQVLEYQTTGDLPVTKQAVTEVLNSQPGLLKPFLQALQSDEAPEPFTTWWNAAELGLVGMASKLASTAAISGSLSQGDIESGLASTQSSLQQLWR